MMENKIELCLDKTITRLAGFEYGKNVYEKQVKGKVDYGKALTIVFPDNITKLASSFIQGFFGDMIEEIGIAGIENQVSIESVNHNLKSSIMENLL